MGRREGRSNWLLFGVDRSKILVRCREGLNLFISTLKAGGVMSGETHEVPDEQSQQVCQLKLHQPSARLSCHYTDVSTLYHIV